MSEEKTNRYTGIKPNQGVVAEEKESVEAERDKLDRVVSSPVKQKKKGLLERLVIGFIGPDGLPRVGDHILHNIVVPTLKNTAQTSLKTGIDMIFRPEQQPPTYYSGQTSNPYMNNYHTTPTPVRNPYTAPTTSNYRQGTGKASLEPRRHSNRVEDYAIASYEDALEVLARIREQAHAYGTVSVHDYYDLIGVDTQYTHALYGWRPEDLFTVNIREVRDGFLLALPPVVEIAK